MTQRPRRPHTITKAEGGRRTPRSVKDHLLGVTVGAAVFVDDQPAYCAGAADPAVTAEFKLDANLPVSVARVLAAAAHDVNTVLGEHLIGRPDQDVVTAPR
jgi:hypothetical protein